MKKYLIALALTVGLGLNSLPAFAGQDALERKQPVKMTEEQMDDVTAGLLAIEILVRNRTVSGSRAFAASSGFGSSVASASSFTRSRQLIGVSLVIF